MGANKRKRADEIPGYLYALDGLRAVSLILIFVFHNWQQSWISYRLQIKPDTYLFDFELWQRYGYIAIDAFFVLSGFCLFYPIARSMFGETEQKISWKTFYLKRARKILPSYLILLVLCLIFPALAYVTYDAHNFGQVMKQFLTHITFTHNFFADTVSGVVPVSWTLAIEVQFYIIFPLIAVMFRKKPVLTFGGLLLLTHVFRLWGISSQVVDTVFQDTMIFYLDIFAWGMLSAYLVVWFRNRMDQQERYRLLMTVLSILGLVVVWQFTKWMGTVSLPKGLDTTAYFRMIYRTILALGFALFLFAACYAYRFWERGIWGNRIFVFLSTISYNFFLWHQNIHILLKKLNIPYTTMNPVQNDRAAMDGFVLLSSVLSLLIATAVTYLVEIPISRYGIKGYGKMICTRKEGYREKKK